MCKGEELAAFLDRRGGFKTYKKIVYSGDGCVGLAASLIAAAPTISARFCGYESASKELS